MTALAWWRAQPLELSDTLESGSQREYESSSNRGDTGSPDDCEREQVYMISSYQPQEGMGMGIKDRAMALTEGAKNRRIEDRNDRIERDNDRLRVENQALKGEMDRDRDRLSTLLDSLESTSTTAGTKSHRLRGLFTLAAAATGAYIMGAKAGRERYEQIRDRWSQMRDRRMSQVRETRQEWADRAGSTVEDAGARASDVIQTASQKAADELVLPSPDGAEWPSTSPEEAPTPPGRVVELDPTTVLAPPETDSTP